MQVVQRSLHVNESVVSADLDNETVLLNIETGLYFGLNELGSTIWSMLEAGEQQDAILERLMEIYDVERDCLQRDMQDFFDLLETRGLASASDPGTR
jgi:hypothetical protein